MAGVLGCASVATPALTAQAQEQQIVLSQNVLNLAAGGSQNVLVDYSNVAGGFADLGVAVSDAAYVQAVLADAGNGQAVLTVTALQSGSASVAVYLNSNMAVVSYATVASGYAPKGQMYTTMAGDTLTTVYDDRIVNYQTQYELEWYIPEGCTRIVIE